MKRVAAAAALGLLIGLACAKASPPAAPTLECADVACKPPSCCGGDCGPDGGCCTGTVCSDLGKCVPSTCSDCGPAGCTYEPTGCTATCNVPSCCLHSCQTQADCCLGTTCGPSSTGGNLCFPTGCDACKGMKPYCKTSAQCGVTCEAPPTCGRDCSGGGSVCGPQSVCRPFADGGQLCVPAAFGAECAACDGGCVLNAVACTVLCVVIVGEPDAGAVDGGDPSAADAGACHPCCASCEPDAGASCCPGSACVMGSDGRGTCLPAQCAACPYGCDYTCPGVGAP